MPYFENTEPGHNKFWEITVEGSRTDVRFGRIGTKGQSQTKHWPTPQEAAQFGEDMINQKLAKGYVEQ